MPLLLHKTVNTETNRNYYKKLSLSMKAYRGGSRGISPLTLNLGTRWKWLVNFAPRPVYPRERTPDPTAGLGGFWGKKTNYNYIQLHMIIRNSSWLRPYCTGVKHGFSSSYEGHKLRCLEQRVQKKVWSPTGRPGRLQEVAQWRIYVIRANKSGGETPSWLSHAF